MRKLILLLTCIALVSYSCDGRKTKKESLEQSVAHFNSNNNSIEIATFQPETYVEVVTDTIMSNSVQVHIKNYSLLNEQILVSNSNGNTSKNQNYQRVFESEISISRDRKPILNTLISAKQFRMIDNSDPFWKNATLQHTWVNQELSTSEIIKLDISFINPKNKAYKLYRMSVDADGQQTIDLVEQRS